MMFPPPCSLITSPRSRLDTFHSEPQGGTRACQITWKLFKPGGLSPRNFRHPACHPLPVGARKFLFLWLLSAAGVNSEQHPLFLAGLVGTPQRKY